VHYVGVVLASKDETRSAHVGSKLVYFIELPIENATAVLLLPEISQHEIIRLGFTEAGELEIHPADPESFSLQSFNQMRTNEPAGTANKSSLQSRSPHA
jgi:hypothetical protein